MEGNTRSMPEGRQEFPRPTVFMFQPTHWEQVSPEDEPKWIAQMEKLTGRSFGSGEAEGERKMGLPTYCYSDYGGYEWYDDCDAI